MIARGNLAVELGYERLAEVQEEVLWVCEAAHMPVIWATQVLESLVKNGLPSRGEITDAAMGARAECVMLNKGPYLLEGIAACVFRSTLPPIPLARCHSFRQRSHPFRPSLPLGSNRSDRPSQTLRSQAPTSGGPRAHAR